MANAKPDTAAAPKKERKPARTIEQRIEELRQLEAERTAKAKAKADKKMAGLDEKILKAESRLGNLVAQREAALAVLGKSTPAADAPRV